MKYSFNLGVVVVEYEPWAVMPVAFILYIKSGERLYDIMLAERKY